MVGERTLAGARDDDRQAALGSGASVAQARAEAAPAGHPRRQRTSTLRRVVRYCDGWYPNRADYLGRIPELRRLAAEAGRGDIPITAGPDAADRATIERHMQAGVQRCSTGCPRTGPTPPCAAWRSSRRGSARISERASLADPARQTSGPARRRPGRPARAGSWRPVEHLVVQAELFAAGSPSSSGSQVPARPRGPLRTPPPGASPGARRAHAPAGPTRRPPRRTSPRSPSCRPPSAWSPPATGSRTADPGHHADEGDVRPVRPEEAREHDCGGHQRRGQAHVAAGVVQPWTVERERAAQEVGHGCVGPATQNRLNRQPPSTGTVTPVTMSNAGLQNTATSSATSPRLTSLPAGV